MIPHLPQDLSDQLKYAMYLPALFPPYATAAIAKSNKFRPMPNGLEPKDLNFLDPASKLFYLPAALYSAGHERDLTKPQQTMITRRVMKDNLFFGDSGGYQIISGKLNANSDDKRKAIFDWQNKYCDFAMTLDVPTLAIENKNSAYSNFEDCLKDTLKHLATFKRLYDNSGRQLKLLNVLQGRDSQEVDIWYEAVKGYDFNGWAIAGPLRKDFYELMRRMLILLRDGKIGGKYEWLHFLGIGDLKTASLLTIIRDGLRHHLNDEDIHCSLDTSSPLLAAGRFKTPYTGHILSKKKFGIEYGELPIEDYRYLNSKEPFPFPTSPIGKQLTLGDIIVKEDMHSTNRWDSLSGYMLMNHNIYVQINAIFQANKELAKHRADTLETVPTNLYNAKCAIEDIFDAADPWAELENKKIFLDRV